MLRDLRALRGCRILRDLRGPLTFTTDALLAAVLAPRCAACATPLEHPTRGPVCEICWRAIDVITPPLCRGCGNALASWRALDDASELCPDCRQKPTSVDASRSAGRYEGSLREIIHAFKYDGRRSLSVRLGAMVRAAGSDFLHGADCVVPVPLHAWRRFRRGFNQAADLSADLGVPVVHALWRARATAPQTGLTGARRRHNVRGAFTISPWLSPRARRLTLVDRVLILVDDVRTTGATLDECAQVLKRAGAREVRALTVALAEPPHRSHVPPGGASITSRS